MPCIRGVSIGMLVAVALLPSGCADAKPTTQDLRKAVEGQVDRAKKIGGRESFEAFRIVSIEKTDGGKDGEELYWVSFSSEIEFTMDACARLEMPWTADRYENDCRGAFISSEPVHIGDRFSVTGTIWFRKTENGWQPNLVKEMTWARLRSGGSGGIPESVVAACNQQADDPSATFVRIIAQQFAWTFHYPGPDGIAGRTDAKLVNRSTNPLGIDTNDSHGSDDIFSRAPLARLPSGRAVRLALMSIDEPHVFEIKSLGIKRTITPGKETVLRCKPGEFGTQPYEIECSKCSMTEDLGDGSGPRTRHPHSSQVIGISTADFDAWIQENAPPKN